MDNSKIQIANNDHLAGAAVGSATTFADHVKDIFKDRRAAKDAAAKKAGSGKTQEATQAANTSRDGAPAGGTATVTMETAHGNFSHSEGGVTNPSEHMAHMAGMFDSIASGHARQATANNVFAAQEGGKIDRAGKRQDSKIAEASAQANHGRSIEHLRAGADVARGFGSTTIHPTEGYKFENPVQAAPKKSPVDVHLGAAPKKVETPAAPSVETKSEPKLVQRDPKTGRAMKAGATPAAAPKKTPAAAKKPKK